MFGKLVWAIVWAIRHVRPYLCGSKFTVQIDHKPLLNVQKQKMGTDPTGRRDLCIVELGLYKTGQGQQGKDVDKLCILIV